MPAFFLAYGPALAAAACIFGGSFLITRFVPPRWQWRTAAALLIFVTPITLFGFWASLGNLGISDWDYYFSLHHTYRHIILEHHTLPLWNPYICGGTAGVGDPEFSVLTPTFLFELIFGIPRGFRLAIFVATSLGSIGMLYLGRRLKLSLPAALAAALIFGFSSVNLLEIVEGHPNIFSALWIPWIFLAWLNAYTKQGAWSSITGMLLAGAFYQGGIYLLTYTGLAFLLLSLLASRRQLALQATVSSTAWAIGFASFKLIPVIFWLSQFQDTAYASSTYILPYLNDIFLGRHLHGAEVIPNQGSGWHEYGAYIGPVALILATIGFIRYRRQRIPQLLLISTVLAIYIASAGPWLKPVFDVLSFIPRSNISRLILFAVISLALLAGKGVEAVTSHRQSLLRTVLGIGLVTVLSLDLFTLAYPLSRQAFVLPKEALSPASPKQPIAYTAQEYVTRYAGVGYTRAYTAITQGYGTLSYCSVLGPPAAVHTIENEHGDDLVSIENNQTATATITDWQPHQVTATITGSDTGTVVLNANYATGWKANGQAAQEIGNRVGIHNIKLPATVTFSYQPPGLLLGLLGTVSTVVLATWRHRSRQRRPTKTAA